MATKNAKKTAPKKAVNQKTKNKTVIKATTVKKPVAKKQSKNLLAKYKAKGFNIRSRDIACLLAEFIGTFLFVAFFLTTQGDPRFAMYAMVAIVLLVGAVSGAIINPAMAIGAWVTKKIKFARALGYICAQALGGIAAWSLISTYAKGTINSELLSIGQSAIFTATKITDGKELYILFAEILGALVLGFGLATSLRLRKNKKSAVSSALVYGMSLYIAMFITYIMVSPLGTGLVFFNPVVAFSTSAISFNVWVIAIYLIAPAIGAVLGFVLQDLLQSQIEISVKEKK